MTADQFRAWLRRARRGQHCVYHRGSLMYDRERLTGTDWEAVDAVGKAAWSGYEAGSIALTQRKVGHLQFDYIATAA